MARLALGDSAPSFDLPGVDGESHSDADFAGRPLAVVFNQPAARGRAGRGDDTERA